MDVYNSVAALVPAEMPKYLMSTVKEADAKKAYEAFLKFKDVVKANPITPQVKDTPAALSSKFGSIEAAAAKLSDASYPIHQECPLGLRHLPEAPPRCLAIRSHEGPRQSNCHGCLQCFQQGRTPHRSKQHVLHVRTF